MDVSFSKIYDIKSLCSLLCARHYSLSILFTLCIVDYCWLDKSIPLLKLRTPYSISSIHWEKYMFSNTIQDSSSLSLKVVMLFESTNLLISCYWIDAALCESTNPTRWDKDLRSCHIFTEQDFGKGSINSLIFIWINSLKIILSNINLNFQCRQRYKLRECMN